MSVEQRKTTLRSFDRAGLPLLAGTGAFLVYLATLNHWISLASLPTVARVSGDLWQPQLLQPLTALLLQPFSVLTGKWLPLALNFFSATAGALALALLVRSVELLVSNLAQSKAPHRGRTLSGLIRWVPALFAALLCGLQLTYWQHATAGTGEMIDLVVFAYIIRCIAEFRMDQRQVWLSRSALLYGMGMANHWALAGYLPVYLVAVVRLKGLDIFDLRFLARMTLWALAGLAFYLVLPIFYWISAADHVVFWPALRSNLSFQKQMLSGIHQAGFTLLGLSAYLPFLVMSYRGNTRVGYDSRFSLIFVGAMINLFFGFFLVAACWMALDPPFSPPGLGIEVPLLTYNYSWALAGGFCAGYLMLSSGAFGSNSNRTSRSRDNRGFSTAYRLIAPLALLIMVLACLLWRNLEQIRAINGPGLHVLAQTLYAELPAGNSVALSDDVTQLLLLQSELQAHGSLKDALILNPSWLASLQYQRFMAHRYKSRWPTTAPTNESQIMKPIPLVSHLSTHEPVMYLHPSFGYFFEIFTAQSAGLIHHLEKRTMTPVVPPPIPAKVVATNENFWQVYWTNTLRALAGDTKKRIQQGAQEASWLSRQLRLPPRPNFDAMFLSAVYSRALNDWGVQMERREQWNEARVWFERAIELNPRNLSAQINLEFNQHRREAGKAGGLDWVEKRLPELTGRYRTWQSVLAENGPVDDPTFLLASAQVWLAGGNYRQAAAEFARCCELGPEEPAPKLGLAEVQIALKNFDGALSLINDLENPALARDADQVEIRRLRAMALLGLGQTNTQDQRFDPKRE